MKHKFFSDNSLAFSKLNKGLLGKFRFPPFSILKTYDAEWAKRKKSWISIGLQSEVGRNEKGMANNSINSIFKRNRKAGGGESRTNISIFDPVLCELMYSWFCPPKGVVIDPFAGGSVRGVIAAYMDKSYWGCELRPEQVQANYEQADILLGNFKQIKISNKMMRQRFHDCNLDYIKNTCKGRCCQGNKTLLVTIHPSEQNFFEQLGAKIDENSFIIPDSRGLCPFKQNDGTCGIHTRKPFGCAASPFTLNSKDTLIIRNRYRLMPCYKERKKIPAYKAHQESLRKILGDENTDYLTKYLDEGGEKDILLNIPYSNYRRLKDNDQFKKGESSANPASGKLNWVCGDSLHEIKKAPEADFIFSCPPYGNLEVYSDIDGDISNLNYNEFLESYQQIITESLSRLKNNRFACFVVSNFRGKQGFIHDFVGDTIKAFENNQVFLYNDIVLATSLGSLPIRAGKIFDTKRKVGKAHQNILVFYKGDPNKIPEIMKKENLHGNQAHGSRKSTRKRKERLNRKRNDPTK